MSIKSIIANPFILYSVTWGLILLLYILHYSDLYPEISIELFSFLIITMLVSFLIGYKFRKVFVYEPISNFSIRNIKRCFLLFLSLIALECFLEGFIPLMPLFSGNYDVEVRDFGFPIVHVVVCNGLSFLTLYAYYCYCSTSDKQIKHKLRNCIFLAFLAGVLLVNRSMLMIIGIGILLMYLLSSPNIKKALCWGTLMTIGGFYLFGFLGNLRTDKGANEHVILEIGLATDDFRESFIPTEFFWGYLYMTSPLSNLQNTVDKKNVSAGLTDLKTWFVVELLPETVSKNFGEYLSLDVKSPELVLDILNVSTVFASSYAYLGWFGMVGMFCFTVFFILFSMFFIPKSSPFLVLGFICINIVILLNIFDNMFSYIGLVPQVLIAIMLSSRSFYERILKRREER